MLRFLRHDVAEAEHIEQTVTLSAEWLLDNMYVIEAGIEDIRLNLPKNTTASCPSLPKVR